MKLNVNSPGYVLTFAAVVSTVFTGAIMTLNAVSERAAADAALLYQQKSLVEVFDLGKDKPRPLGNEQVRELYRQFIRPYDKRLRDPKTGIVFNDPNAAALAPRTYVAVAGGGEILGYALPITGIGFWARIDGYLAVTPDLSKVIGIVFVRHQETPGLGGRITEPRWREQFRGLRIAPQAGGGKYVHVGGDRPREKDNPRYGRYVDAITGATGTSTAVEQFINRDIEAFRRAAEAVGIIGKREKRQQNLTQRPQRSQRELTRIASGIEP